MSYRDPEPNGSSSTHLSLKERVLEQLGDYLPPYIDVEIDLAVGGRPRIGVTVSNSRFVNKEQVEQQIENALGAMSLDYTLIWNQ